MKPHFKELLGQYLEPPMLQLGCALNKEPGFETVDLNPKVEPTYVHDLANTPLPMDSNRYNLILATHVMEHLYFEDVLRLMPELYRVLKPGGALLVAVPHGSSDDAWENPHHRSYWSERTFAYFTPDLYRAEGTPGYGATQGGQYPPWGIAWVRMSPYAEFLEQAQQDPEAFTMGISRHARNVIREMQALMLKGVQN